MILLETLLKVIGLKSAKVSGVSIFEDKDHTSMREILCELGSIEEGLDKSSNVLFNNMPKTLIEGSVETIQTGSTLTGYVQYSFLYFLFCWSSSHYLLH